MTSRTLAGCTLRNENDNTEVRNFLELLGEIPKATGASVLVLDHSGKPSAEKVRAGITMTPRGASAKHDWADLVMVLAPDTVQPAVYEAIRPCLTAGRTLMFAHGFNIHFGTIKPPSNVDVTMIAPKAPGHRVREVFKDGGGTPGLLAVQQDATGHAKALAPQTRVNLLSPGWVRTPMAEAELKALGSLIAGALPNRRVGEVADCAHAALYLASEASGHLVGQDLCVSGGALLVVPRGQIVASEP